MTRPIRAQRSNREEESRINEKGNSYSMFYQNRLEIPDSAKREGYTQTWVRHSIKGENDLRVERYAAQGYELVPKSRGGGGGTQGNPLGRSPMGNDWIIVDDLILMEIPTHIYEQKQRSTEIVAETRADQLMGVSDDLYHQSNIKGSTR